ncbi:MAG: glycosyltransferase family 4 protein [Acidobacteria bacterium]|nr:glycosyltransferase family 4 protein [Acidobacteriota bacterium]
MTRFLDLVRVAAQYVDLSDLVLIEYFFGAAFLRLLRPSGQFVSDVRTASIHPRAPTRFVSDALTRLELKFFRNLCVISEGLKERLGMPAQALVLPLGADPIIGPPKDFSAGLRLLYIGTLTNRRIEATIQGLRMFLDKNHSSGDLSYSIVGDGYGQERAQLTELAARLGLQDRVTLHGYVHHTAIRPHFDSSNVGVSFIPITPYYDHQPPTKTFEYLLAGMPVIATDTAENRRVISQERGVLIEDNAAAFAEGLEVLSSNLTKFDSKAIREQAMAYSWESIIEKSMVPYLERLVRSSSPRDTS